MSSSLKRIDDDTLQALIPLNTLDRGTLSRVLRDAKDTTLHAGHTLFERGDATRTTIYLLEGEIALSSPLSAEECLRAGSAAARYPVAHHLPRHVNARALSTVRVLIINGDISEISQQAVSRAKPREQAAARDDQWKTKWLQSPLFRHMPRANIDVLLRRMEEIDTQAGQVIIHQDENADCYYVIKQGRCSVSRRPAPRARDVKLAELGVGQGFGEEALITHATRNASITMIEDGVLLRLSKEDFIDLLANPLLRHLPFEEAMARPDTVLVDVRSPEEFETDGLIGSLNMPMPVLRLKAHRFDPRQTYVVYSNTGHFSTAAAFLLLQQGLDAFVLKGGLSNVPRHRMKHPVKHGGSAHEDGYPAKDKHAVVSFPERGQPKPEARDHDERAENPSVSFDWVSDEAMWRNTIGLRNDEKIDALFTPSDMYRNQSQDNSIQGFEEVRLFTSVDNLKGAKLSLASNDEDQRPAPIAFGKSDDTAGRIKSSDSDFTFSSSGRRDASPAAAPHAQTGPRPPFKRGGLFALVLLLIGAGFAAAYFNNEEVRSAVNQAPDWLEQQRDMDAKLTRLLDTMEKLPGLKQAQGTAPAAAPVEAPTPSAPEQGLIERTSP